MKSESSTVQGDAASLVQGEDIFFRAEDIQFANGIADAIADDLTSLELIGTSAAAINHYGRLLLKRLRQHPNIELEAYLPTGVESLVDQFNVALSSIYESLRTTPAETQLIISSYAAGYAVFLITGGRLGDLFGRRTCYLWGMAAFALTNLACGLAMTPTQLLVARVFQGAAAALLLHTTQSVLI
jgi:hypothetical protein